MILSIFANMDLGECRITAGLAKFLVWKNTLFPMKFVRITQNAAPSFGFHIYILVQIFENIETLMKIVEFFFLRSNFLFLYLNQ